MYLFILCFLKEPPEISNMSPLEIIVIEGMPSLLECKALGYPYPNISWSYNQVVLLNGTRELILIRRNATKSFSGEYTCRAENPLGNMSITRKLTVVGEFLTDLTVSVHFFADEMDHITTIKNKCQ